MKKTYSILNTILCLIPSSLIAQPVYSSLDYAASGDTIYITKAQLAPLDFEVTGSNYFWDYSALLGTSQRQLLFRNPNQTGVIWPFIYNSANTNLSSTDNSSITIGQLVYTNPNDFYLINSNSLRQTASTSVIVLGNLPYTLKNQYSSPDVLLKFPVVYGNIDSSYSEFTTSIPNLFSRNTSIKRKNEVTGWGTVITPYGTFTNTLKIESTVMQIDSIVVDTLQEIIDTTYYRDLRWMDASREYDLLTVRQTKVGNTYTTQSIEYLDNQQYFPPNALFVFNPINPLVGDTVYFQSLSQNYDLLIWDFDDPLSGINNSSTLINPIHQYSSPGIYEIELIAFNGPLSDTLILPLTINDPPNASFDSIVTTENTSVAINVLLNDSDLYGGLNPNSVSIVNSPQNGVATVDFSSGEITYTPNINYYGSDSFTYEVCDNGNPILCDSSSVFITVNQEITNSLSSLANGEHKIVVHPNPFENSITLNTSNKEFSYSICFINGRKIFEANDLKECDFSRIESGMYWLIITENGNLIDRLKIVKK